MYMDIPKSCEFGGCKLYEDCPNKEYKIREHKGRNFSPPSNREECVNPCEMCEECFSYMDKYGNSFETWAELHGEME